MFVMSRSRGPLYDIYNVDEAWREALSMGHIRLIRTGPQRWAGKTPAP